jgi:hypothetical protein
MPTGNHWDVIGVERRGSEAGAVKIIGCDGKPIPTVQDMPGVRAGRGLAGTPAKPLTDATYFFSTAQMLRNISGLP